MANKLRKLALDRVDLVPEGANPDAHIVLMKSKESVEKATFEEIRDSRELSKMLNEVYTYTWDLQDAIHSSLYSDGDRAKEIRQSINQFSKAVDSALSSWLEGKPLTKEAFDKVHPILAEHRDYLASLKEETVSKKDEKTNDTDEKVEKGEQKPPTPPSPPPPSPPSPPSPPAPKTVAKSDDDEPEIPASIQKVLDAQASEIAKAKKEAEDARAEARVEKEKRETAEYVVKAKAEIPNLKGTDAEKGAMLQKVFGKLEKTDADALLSLLKGADAAQRTLLQMGHQGEVGGPGDDTNSDSAKDQLYKKRDELVKTDTKLSKATAFAKVCRDNPDLYRQYQRERGTRLVQ